MSGVMDLLGTWWSPLWAPGRVSRVASVKVGGASQQALIGGNWTEVYCDKDGLLYIEGWERRQVLPAPTWEAPMVVASDYLDLVRKTLLPGRDSRVHAGLGDLDTVLQEVWSCLRDWVK